jgi:hypothetical protein
MSCINLHRASIIATKLRTKRYGSIISKEKLLMIKFDLEV